MSASVGKHSTRGGVDRPSPFKSALKHSPSSSVRNASPEVRFGSSPGSDMGEGSHFRRRTQRVSFDETPHILSGLENSKYANADPASPETDAFDLDNIMKPTPALPSFGSVRATREAPKPEPKSMGHSNDHMVGGILSQDFANRQAPRSLEAPLAPEVTSVEGSGYASDNKICIKDI